VAAATFGIDAPWLPTFTVAPVVTEFLQARDCLCIFNCSISGRFITCYGHAPWLPIFTVVRL